MKGREIQKIWEWKSVVSSCFQNTNMFCLEPSKMKVKMHKLIFCPEFPPISIRDSFPMHWVFNYLFSLSHQLPEGITFLIRTLIQIDALELEQRYILSIWKSSFGIRIYHELSTISFKNAFKTGIKWQYFATVKKNLIHLPKV